MIRFRQTLTNNVNTSLLTLFVALSFIFGFFVFSSNDSSVSYKEDILIDEVIAIDKATIVSKDKAKEQVSLPRVIKTKDAFDVILDLSPYKKVHKKTLSFQFLYSKVKIYGDDKLIFSLDRPKDAIFKSNAYSVVLVALPKLKDPKVRLHIEPLLPHLDLYDLREVELGKKSAIIMKHLKDDLLACIVSGFLFFNFVVIVSFVLAKKEFFIKKNNSDLLHLAMLGFVVAIYLFVQQWSAKYFFSSYREFLYALEFIVLIFLPSPLLLLLKNQVSVGFGKIINLVRLIIVINFLTQVILSFSSILEFREMLPITHLIFIFSIVVLFASIFFIDKKNTPNKGRFIALLGAMIVFMSVSIFFFLVYHIQIFEDLGLLAAFIVMLLEVQKLYEQYNMYKTELMQQKIYKKLATQDQLTGLPNRQAFDGFIKKKSKDGNLYLLILIDLDMLRRINDSVGSHMGDAILRTFAKRLERFADKDDFVARLGSDDFIIIHTLETGNDATPWLKRLSEVCDEVVCIDEYSFDIFVSIGATYCGKNIGISPSHALSQADLAMHKAKERQNVSSYELFSSSFSIEAKKNFEIEMGLKRALKNQEFVLFYQPKISLNDGSIIGHEALIRWNSPKIGLVPPFEFIPHAEQNGLILPMSNWVIQTACKQSIEWEKQGKPAKIACNLSALQFAQEDFVEQVFNILEKTGASPTNIEFEITESTMMKDMDKTLSSLNKLKSFGFTLAIDDFGTGYSSMSYLKQMPIDVLKMDKSFIDNVPNDSKDCDVAVAIISLAHTLGMKVVAEGIEHTEQAKFLQQNHCEYVQGYLYSKPKPVEEI